MTLQQLSNELPPIPDFLLVENRKPLTKKQQARVAELLKHAHQDVDRVDWNKPRGTSWEEWDAHLVQKEAAKREKTIARVSVLKEKYGDRHRHSSHCRLPPICGSAQNGRSVTRVRLGGGAAKMRTGTPLAGSKVSMIADLLMRPSGCTTVDVLAATGWPAVSMPAQARSAGLTLRKERVGGVLRYYGTRGKVGGQDA